LCLFIFHSGKVLKFKVVYINNNNSFLKIIKGASLSKWRNKSQLFKLMLLAMFLFLQTYAGSHAAVHDVNPIQDNCILCQHADGTLLTEVPSYNLGIEYFSFLASLVLKNDTISYFASTPRLTRAPPLLSL